MKSKYVNKKEDLFAFFSLNKDNRINFFSVESIFTHYFLFITSSALFLFFFNRGTIFNAGFPLLIGTMFFITRNRVNKNSIDILWYLCLFWIGFTWIINDYPNKLPLIINCILTQICYMFAYWIGRCSSKNYIQEIIKKSYFPLLLVCSIGIYLYISPPSWYSARISDVILANGKMPSDEVILELTRLKSIFLTTYTLAYFTAIVLVYNFYRILQFRQETSIWNYLLVIILIITSVLCSMRSPIACWIMGFFLASFYIYKFQNSFAGFKLFLFIIICLIVLILLLSNYMDLSQIEFIIDKFNSVSEDNFVEKRLYLMGIKESFLGEGAGKYDIMAYYVYGMKSMPDGEYMKILAEQGYVGLLLTISVFGCGLLKALRNFRYLYMEFFLLSMLFICMIGADPLTISDKHCFMYWLALGQVSKYK